VALILFLWLPVFISNQRLTSQTLMCTDLLSLTLTIAATVLLVGWSFTTSRAYRCVRLTTW
jgi:hypothetical protein